MILSRSCILAVAGWIRLIDIMKITALLLFLSGSLHGSSIDERNVQIRQSAHDYPVASIVTNYGEIRFRLFADDAPESVNAFLTLIQQRKYDKSSIYRVVDESFLQFGIGYEKAMTEKYIPVDKENSRKNIRGAVGFARQELYNPESCTTEVYILHRDIPELDAINFHVFGQIISGYDVLDKIMTVPVEREWKYFKKGILVKDSAPDAEKVSWFRPVVPIDLVSISVGLSTDG